MATRHYPAPHSSAALILAHGAGAGQTHPFMVRTASALAAHGVETFTFDFPYMARKRGAPDRAPVLEASFLETIAEVRPGIGARPLFIGGKSMGGRIATQIAARDDFSGVRGIVVLGYPLHPPGKPDTLRVAHLPAVRAPILVVQGTRDAFGSPEELRPYFGPDRATIHAIDKGDHSFVIPKSKTRPQEDVYAEIVRVVVEWIDRIGRG